MLTTKDHLFKSLVTLRSTIQSSIASPGTTFRGNKVSTMEAANINLRSLIASREWKHVMRKINSEPKSISQKQEIELCGQRTEAYPLHQVVSQRPPLNIVDAMVSVFPDACWLPDDVLGKLPLHIACQNRASGEVQRCLLIAFPDAVKLTDTVERRLPLHYACIDGYLNEVSLLIAAEKRALKAKDIHGKTPVDLCQASFSPHRDAILKRMYEIAKCEGNHSRPKEKPQQAQATLAVEEPTQTQFPFESPSNITVNASNLTKDKSNGKAHGMLSPMKSGKSKSMLPAWARGRKASKSNIQPSPSRKRHSSVDTEKRSNVPKGAKKRGSSLERLRPRRNSFKSDNLPLVDILDPWKRTADLLRLVPCHPIPLNRDLQPFCRHTAPPHPVRRVGRRKRCLVIVKTLYQNYRQTLRISHLFL